MINVIFYKVFSTIIFLVVISCNQLFSYNNENIRNEIGYFPVKNYSANDYNSLPQIWSIVQDKRGIVYFGNRDGVLQFDGTTWKKIKIGDDLIGRSICLGNDGFVYVGSENDFGYLKTTKNGALKFKSLLPLLNTNEPGFGDIWKTFSFNNSVVFQSSNKIFVFNNGRIVELESESSFSNSFLVDNMLFVLENEKGLYRYENNSLKLIENTEFLGDENLYILLPYQYNILLGITDKSGAYLLNYFSDKNSIKKVKRATEIDGFIKKNQVYSGLKVDLSIFSVGTFKGIKVINEKGQFLYDINKTTGCIDENVKYQFIDQSGSLWLGLSNGISNVQVNSPISYFTDKHNINGTIEWITRYKEKIFIATSVGAYYFTKKNEKPQFVPQKDIKPTETWITESFSLNGSEILLVEQNEKIYQVDNDYTTIIYEGIPWDIYQDKIDVNKFYFGNEEGVNIFYQKNSIWQKHGKIGSINERITDIVQDYENNLWLSAETKGLFKSVDGTYSKFEFYSDTNGLPGGPYIFTMVGKELKIGTSDGIYRYNSVRDTFLIDENFRNAFGNQVRYIHRLSVDSYGKLWAVTYIDGEHHEVGYFDYNTDSLLYWNPVPFLANIKGQINAIYHDNNGVTWLGGSEGLFRYDSNIKKDYEKDFYCLIRKVRLGEDSTYFYGNYYNEEGVVSEKQPESLKPILDYSYNSLIFDYSAMNVEVDHETKYSYYLDGYDKKWSEWSTETKKEYTNLPERKYHFRVKAKNVYNHQSREAIFEFEILPPWYRTWLAYLLFVVAAFGIIYLFVKQYTKYLRAVIREKTAEIREQKDEIEKQKDEITASIKYAERIQKAIVPTKERAEELLPEHFIMWRPRDIVSGDFWWMAEKNGLVAIVAADCTGHGVPGAFMSMLGVAFLNEIVAKNGISTANVILDELRKYVKKTLKQTGKEGESKDGMDLALVIIDKEKSQIQYAGAYNPLFIVRDGKLIETKADRNPIGIYIKELETFTNHIIDIQKGDTIYTFSDGFVDQFGGEKGSKYKTKNFKALLLEIQDKPMKEQHDILYKTVDDWRGKWEQVDDIIIVGIRF